MRSFWIAAAALALAAPAHAQPVPAPRPAQPAPWANKFFLPDIDKNREQPPPPFIQHNFGDVAHGTLCTHTFKITNIYDVPMQITNVRMSCSCLGYTPMSRVLQPNETGEFTVTMNSAKFVGANSQIFYVTFGPKYISEAEIRVSANSKTDVTVNPGAVIFGIVPQGTRASQSVKLEYKGRSRDWKILEAVAAKSLDVRVVETGRGGVLRGGADYLLTVSLKPGVPAGAIAEQITLKTNDPAHPLLQIMATATIAPPLEVAPARVRMDNIAVGRTGQQRVLIRAARPFKVLRVDGVGEGVTVELPSTARTALPVQVITVKFDRKKPTALDRDLRVLTDLDGGAAVTVPVEAEAIK